MPAAARIRCDRAGSPEAAHAEKPWLHTKLTAQKPGKGPDRVKVPDDSRGDGRYGRETEGAAIADAE